MISDVWKSLFYQILENLITKKALQNQVYGTIRQRISKALNIFILFDQLVQKRPPIN